MLRPLLFAAFAPVCAWAETPKVVTDIAPVHSLVAQVMQGAGSPVLLLDAGVSPQDANLAPSQLAALQGSGLVIVIGEELTPWLPDMITSLAPDTTTLSLLDSAVVRIEPHTHDHDNGHSHGDEGHEHGHQVDPHAWLDVDNAGAWLGQIAQALSVADPDNAQLYFENAAMAQQSLSDLSRSLPDTGGIERGFVAYHNSYAYFARRQEFVALGTIASDKWAPLSPDDLENARVLFASGKVACLFIEAQFSEETVETVTEGLDVKVVELDPLGTAHQPGLDLFGNMISDMGAGFRACFAQSD